MKNYRDCDKWKNKEPKPPTKEQRILEKQRRETEKNLVLNVKVSCLKTKLYRMGFYTSFNVNVSIPMRREEFMKRMEKAFPELTRRR